MMKERADYRDFSAEQASYLGAFEDDAMDECDAIDAASIGVDPDDEE